MSRRTQRACAHKYASQTLQPITQTTTHDTFAYLTKVSYGFWDAIKCVGMACLRGCGRPNITVWGNLISCLVIGYPMCILMTFGMKLEVRTAASHLGELTLHRAVARPVGGHDVLVAVCGHDLRLRAVLH